MPCPEISIKTGKKEFDDFIPQIKKFLEKDYLDVVIDSQKIRGYRSPDAKSVWIRDHSDIMRGFKYFEQDMKSTVQHFADTQAANGRIFDYFTVFPEKLPSERENWTKYVRVPVEADVEYRFVNAAYLAWQATGDDTWVKKLLPSLERALNYTLTHPWRWDEKTQLVKRPYTIDTWDFAYTAGSHDWLQFQIDDNTFWGIMHGDNSGFYQAFLRLSKLYDHFDEKGKAGYWAEKAQLLKEQAQKVCWNGSFFTHFVKLTPVTIDGVDEASQLSMSNPMDINRGMATHEMAVSIIKEYQKRKETSGSFAEWFSIHPAFPDNIFGDELLVPGAYINGGIYPLVGGELAKAALDHGFEEYGIDILKQYYKLVSETGETFLWYFPDGSASSIETSTSPDATPTDGWGSSAMLYAFVEGLAGIEDTFKLYQKAKISPRWTAAGVSEAQVDVSYASSETGIGYTYLLKNDSLELNVTALNSDLDFHVLLPKNKSCKNVTAGKKNVSFSVSTCENSNYVDFTSTVQEQKQIVIHF